MSAQSARIDESLAGRLLGIIALGVVASLAILFLTKDLAMSAGTYFIVVLISYAIMEGMK